MRTRQHLALMVVPLLLVPLVATVASAQESGTHFLVEPYTGVTFNQGFSREDAVGFESGLVAAVGGKFKGFPPRFYLYFRVAESLFGDDDVYVPSRQANVSVNRSYTQLTGGLRVVIPLFWKLRLNLEVGGGAVFSQNSLTESGTIEYPSYAKELIIVETGIGLNLRLFNWLSVGLMYDYSFVAQKTRGDFFAQVMDEKNDGCDLGWSHLTATVGFHF
jgi:hypothetical protein